MLTYKQYKILFGINTLIENNNIISEHSSGCRIIGDKIYECTKYPKYTVDTILKELHEQKYIYDIACESFTSVHAIKIESKGKDALKYHRKDIAKSILSKIFWMVLGAIITQIFRELISL